MATMLSRRISLLNCELSQQCSITLHVEKERHKLQPSSSGSSSALEESGSTHELPGVCVCVCVCVFCVFSMVARCSSLLQRV